jgi:hypothetical protein
LRCSLLVGQYFVYTAGGPPYHYIYGKTSHRHFDHAGGLALLLTAMGFLPEASLTVYALPKTLKAMRELLALMITA